MSAPRFFQFFLISNLLVFEHYASSSTVSTIDLSKISAPLTQVFRGLSLCYSIERNPSAPDIPFACETLCTELIPEFATSYRIKQSGSQPVEGFWLRGPADVAFNSKDNNRYGRQRQK